MPELPEVETVRRGLEKLIKGYTITAAHELAKELAARSEALKEAALTKADVGAETMAELRALLKDAAEMLESLRRADAGATA